MSNDNDIEFVGAEDISGYYVLDNIDLPEDTVAYVLKVRVNGHKWVCISKFTKEFVNSDDFDSAVKNLAITKIKKQLNILDI